MSSPRTTIVGGRPPEQGDSLPPVPTGIQRLLRLASVDEDFRRELAARPVELASTAGVELNASERAVLEAMPGDRLAEMARKMPPPPSLRRGLLRQTAATAVVLLGGAALSGTMPACNPGEELGEEPPTRAEVREMQGEGGAAPEEPPPRPEERDVVAGLIDGVNPQATPPEEPTPPDREDATERPETAPPEQPAREDGED